MEEVHTSADNEPVQPSPGAPDLIWLKYPILCKLPIKEGKYAQKTIFPWFTGILAMYHLTNRLLMGPEINVLPHGMLRSNAHSPDERKEEEAYLRVIEIRKHQPILKPLNADLSSAKQYLTHVLRVSPQLLLATLAKKLFSNSLLEKSAWDKLA